VLEISVRIDVGNFIKLPRKERASVIGSLRAIINLLESIDANLQAGGCNVSNA
jgi:hypothetical protein